VTGVGDAAPVPMSFITSILHALTAAAEAGAAAKFSAAIAPVVGPMRPLDGTKQHHSSCNAAKAQ